MFNSVRNIKKKNTRKTVCPIKLLCESRWLIKLQRHITARNKIPNENRRHQVLNFDVNNTHTHTQNQLNQQHKHLPDDWRRQWAWSTFTAHNHKDKRIYLQFFSYFFIKTIRTHGRATALAMHGLSWQQQNTRNIHPLHDEIIGKNRHVRLFVTTLGLTMIHLALLSVWAPQRRLTIYQYTHTSKSLYCQWDKRRGAYPPGWISLHFSFIRLTGITVIFTHTHTHICWN